MSESKKYDIKAIETAKSGLPQRQAAKDQIMPKFPFSMMITGRSGSGKTNLMINIMTRPEMYGKFFHMIVVFSPTAGISDDLYSQLKLPAENYVPDLKPEYLENIIKARKTLIEEKGIDWVGKNMRMLIIMDDVIANRDFLESPGALKMFALLRHFLCSIIVMVQSYNKLPRSLRINANAVMVFPALQSEIDVLKDEITPAGISKKDFGKVIAYATEGRYDFLYLNNHADPGKRVRKNLDEIIDLDKFKSKDIAKENKDVTSRRRYTKDTRGSEGRTINSEQDSEGREALQSRHSRLKKTSNKSRKDSR